MSQNLSLKFQIQQRSIKAAFCAPLAARGSTFHPASVTIPTAFDWALLSLISVSGLQMFNYLSWKRGMVIYSLIIVLLKSLGLPQHNGSQGKWNPCCNSLTQVFPVKLWQGWVCFRKRGLLPRQGVWVRNPKWSSVYLAVFLCPRHEFVLKREAKTWRPCDSWAMFPHSVQPASRSQNSRQCSFVRGASSSPTAWQKDKGKTALARAKKQDGHNGRTTRLLPGRIQRLK